MNWLRFCLAILLLALFTAAAVAVLLPYADCAGGMAFRDGFVPYCGTPPVLPA